jgi:glucokinase
VGIDLGGTWVRVVVSDGKGRFLGKVIERVERKTAKSVSAQMVRLTRSLCSMKRIRIESVKGVGIAATGPLSMSEGALVHPTALHFSYVPLTEPVSEGLDVPSCLVNDAAAGAYGEGMFGAAKKLDNYVYVTISTGIGCGAVVNGTLLLGKDGNAHEVGHIVIDCEGRLTCGCGRKGHWEAYCSGSKIPNFVRMRLKDVLKKKMKESLLFKSLAGDFSRLRASDLFKAAKEGDHLSKELVGELGLLNAMGFASVINVYDPSLVTVGGMVALMNKDMILEPIVEHVQDYALNRIPKIRVTPLGDDVGLYGAVATAMNRLS